MGTPVVEENVSKSRKIFEIIGIMLFVVAALSVGWWAITEVIEEINNLPLSGIFP